MLIFGMMHAGITIELGAGRKVSEQKMVHISVDYES